MYRVVLTVMAFVLVTACSKDPPPEAVSPPGKNSLPGELEPFRKAIEASKLDYVRIKATRHQGTDPRASKFRGLPYRPKGAPWPIGRDGEPLMLLAQINFADTPPLAGYPRTGILQFFISGFEGKDPPHVWGMTLYDEQPFDADKYFQSLQDQASFRVIWHANVIADVAQLDVTAPPLPGAVLPVNDEALLSFTTDAEYVSLEDYRFERLIGKDPWDLFASYGPRESEIADQYYLFSHREALAKIGGYAVFTQDDPRRIRPSEDWLILLEIRSGTEGGVDVMWGDVGVGAFLIRREDLARQDFSRVAYYWDCH